MDNRWQWFLKQIENKNQVFLVGPLYNGRAHKLIGPTIFVDGGVQFRSWPGDQEEFPTVSVGDGDSGQASLDVKLPEEKNFSDLAFVLNHLPKSIRHVELLGFLGGRRDHELINYGEVHTFLKSAGAFTTVRFDDMIIAFCGGNLSININETFTVVVFETSTLTIRGACKYPINQPAVFSPVSSQGLSNQGFGRVDIDSLNPCFLFLG